MNGKCAGACALALVLLSPTTEAQTSGSLDGAVWLAGDWVLVDSGRCVEEHWTAPSANSMVGAGRTVKDGRTTSFEFVEGADAGKPFAVDYAYRRASTGERACAVAK